MEVTAKNDPVKVPRELLERACMRPRMELAVNHQDIADRGRAQAEIRELLAATPTAAPAAQEPVGHELDGLAGDLLVAADLVRNKAVSSRLVEYSRHVAKLAYCTPAPDAGVLVEALEQIIRQYPSANFSHVGFRVHACQQAEHALAEYRATLAGKGGE